MNSQKTTQDDAAHEPRSAQAAPGSSPAGGQGAMEAGRSGDRHAVAQAVRSVMHPESHEPEWRYVYGAMHG
jgi:hypothetical protein